MLFWLRGLSWSAFVVSLQEVILRCFVFVWFDGHNILYTVLRGFVGLGALGFAVAYLMHLVVIVYCTIFCVYEYYLVECVGALLWLI